MILISGRSITKQHGLITNIIPTNLVPEAGNDDGDVTDATDDHEEDIGDSKAVVAHNGHSEKIPSIFLTSVMIL